MFKYLWSFIRKSKVENQSLSNNNNNKSNDGHLTPSEKEGSRINSDDVKQTLCKKRKNMDCCEQPKTKFHIHQKCNPCGYICKSHHFIDEFHVHCHECSERRHFHSLAEPCTSFEHKQNCWMFKMFPIVVPNCDCDTNYDALENLIKKKPRNIIQVKDEDNLNKSKDGENNQHDTADSKELQSPDNNESKISPTSNPAFGLSICVNPHSDHEASQVLTRSTTTFSDLNDGMDQNVNCTTLLTTTLTNLEPKTDSCILLETIRETETEIEKQTDAENYRQT